MKYKGIVMSLYALCIILLIIAIRVGLQTTHKVSNNQTTILYESVILDKGITENGNSKTYSFIVKDENGKNDVIVTTNQTYYKSKEIGETTRVTKTVDKSKGGIKIEYVTK